MSNFLNFLSNYGSIAAGFFAVCGAVIGILSSYASHQAAQQSRENLERAVKVIERLETVIGDQWEALDVDQVEILRKAIVDLPFKGNVQVMYLNSLGKAFALSIANAFRAAQWEVNYSTGGGFENGVEFGWGPKSPTVGKALASVIPNELLVPKGVDRQLPDGYFFVGVGSKPPKK